MISQWENLARDGQLADAMVSYVADHVGTTFAELEQRFSPWAEGPQVGFGRVNWGVYFWVMATSLVDVVIPLLETRTPRLYLFPCSTFLYLIDGCSLRFPLVKGRERIYDKPHWLPVTLGTERGADEPVSNAQFSKWA
jgi:hypothetical protein